MKGPAIHINSMASEVGSSRRGIVSKQMTADLGIGTSACSHPLKSSTMVLDKAVRNVRAQPFSLTNADIARRRSDPGLLNNILVITPPVMVLAGVPRPLATARPSICRISTITSTTFKVLPSMVSAWFKKPRSAGTSADRANEKKGFIEGNGILKIEGNSAIEGSGVLVKRVPREQRGQHILNGLVIMPCVKVPGNLEGSGL